IQPSRKKSVETATHRFLACLLAILFSVVFFETLGYSAFILTLLLIIFILSTIFLKIEKDIILSTVITLNIYTFEYVYNEFIYNLFFETLIYSVFILKLLLIIFIPSTIFLKIEKGIMTSTVITLNIYTFEKVNTAFIYNQLWLIIIGIGTGLVINLYMPSLD